MKLEPIWRIAAKCHEYPSLKEHISVDVAIIGGGITGITTAQLLKKHGFSVAILESRNIAQGTTGQSTGNLYALTEYRLKELTSTYDLETIQQVILARLEALEQIRNTVDNFGLDCELHNRNMYLFTTSDKYNIEEERSIADKLGIPTEDLSDQHFSFNYTSGLVLHNQAQLNPLTYVQELAKHIEDGGVRIHEKTCVEEISEADGHVILKGAGFEVKAKYAIHATHTPKGLQIPYHTTLGPYREYGIAVKLKSGNYPDGIFWGHFGSQKYSVRSYERDNDKYLICVGSMHKVGQADDNRQNIEELIDFVNRHFDVASVAYAWGGQNYKPADMLPYIGVLKSGSRQYVATGFSTDGLIYGTVAAKIISDEITGIENEFSEIFKANRHQPLKVAKEFIKENVDVVEHLIGDYFKKGEDQEIKDLLPDEGKLLQRADGKYAVYKNKAGEVTMLSPICPHMKCTVNWNKAEKTWDCPCHGSRFDTEGRLIEGPSLDGLKKI